MLARVPRAKQMNGDCCKSFVFVAFAVLTKATAYRGDKAITNSESLRYNH